MPIAKPIITEKVLDLIFPKTCLVCGRFDDWLCRRCLGAVRLRTQQSCAVCGRPAINGVVHPACGSRNTLDGAMAASNFLQVRDLIHAFKYQLIRDLGGILAAICLRFMKSDGYEKFFSSFVLVPVPLYASRERFRGFNQGERIAEALASELNLKTLPGALVRVRDTVPQTTLDRRERLENLDGAFAAADPDKIKGKKILLVDDVATTFATLNQCARVLKRAGATSVWGLVVAKE